MSKLPLFVVRDIVCAPTSTWTSAERFVALMVSDRMGGGAESWPSLADICSRTGLSRSTVLAALRKLCSGRRRIFDRQRRVPRTTRYTLAPTVMEGSRRWTVQEVDHSKVQEVDGTVQQVDPTVQEMDGERLNERLNERLTRRTATEREFKSLDSDPVLRGIAETWREAFNRKGRTLGVLRATKRALEAGHAAEDIKAAVVAVARAQTEPGAFPERSSIRWAAENNRSADYVLRPSTLERLIPEAHRKPKGDAVPFDQLPFDEQDRRLRGSV